MSDPIQALLAATQAVKSQAAALQGVASGASGAARKVLSAHARFLSNHANRMAQNAQFLARKSGGGGSAAGAGAAKPKGGTNGAATANGDGAPAPAPSGSGGLQIHWAQARIHSGFPPEARRWRKGEKGKWIYAAATAINKRWKNNQVIPFSYNGKPCVARQTWHSLQAATGRTGRFKATEVYPRK